MAPIPPRARPGSIGELARAGLKLRVFCNRCSRTEARIPASVVAAHAGSDVPVYGAWRYFRCAAVVAPSKVCGARGSQGDVYSLPEHPVAPMGLGSTNYNPNDAWREAERRVNRPRAPQDKGSKRR